MKQYRNRVEGGQALAPLLTHYSGRPDVLVLGLPRGGVPVAFQVAKALGVPMDVLVVRKLGVPGHEELAMGALASGGVRVLNDDVVDGLRIPQAVIDRATEKEEPELRRRERLYRSDRPFPEVRGKTLIVVDDGLATGSTMRAAVAALRELQPARIVVAVPTAPERTCTEFAEEADECVCADIPEWFYSVGQSYEEFPQMSDEEVREWMDRAARELPAASPSPAGLAGAPA